MTQKNNPFANFDLSKLMGEFDPSKMMSAFSQSLGDIKVPGFDTEALMQSQQKNIEALTTANKVALEGIQAVIRRQSEIMQQTLDEVSQAMTNIGDSGGDIQGAAAKQVDQAKAAFEKALSNARELAEMSAKSNAEAADAINARFTESMDELKDMILNLKK